MSSVARTEPDQAGAGAPDHDPETAEVRPGPAPIALAMARTIVAAVFFGLCLVALLFVIVSGASLPSVLVAACLLLALFGMQVFYFSRPGVELRSRTSYLLLAVQACLVYLPVIEYGDSWLGLPSLVGGTVLLVLPRVLAWIAFGLMVVSTAWLEAALSGVVLNGIYLTISVSAFALGVYGLTRLAGVIAELHAARSELAGAAVAHERLRFARDLHDLLGLRLSEIAPKGELAQRVLDKDPDRAGRELSEILDISRRALADVRSVARGYRELNLDEASRAATAVLAAARVDLRMELKHAELPVPIRSLIAEVLREGATNILRHSEAERCEFVLRQSGNRVSLDIVNDGVVDPDFDDPLRAGGGVAGLAGRVAELGGELTAGLDPDGRRFRLHMRVPVAGERDDAGAAQPDELISRTATGAARAVLGTVLILMYVSASLRLVLLVEMNNDAGDVVSIGCTTALLLIQWLHYSRPGVQFRTPVSYALLALQALLVFLPLLLYGVAWVALPGVLLASVLLVLPPVLGWVMFALITAVLTVAQASLGGTMLWVAYNVVGALMIGLVVYGLTWMVRAVAALREARIALARAAVAEERLRFARDLHDLLGLSLSAIALKSELAHRLVSRDPDRARDQLGEVLAISRLALADVRSVASGHRELSLHQESHTAESLLLAADVDVRMDLRYRELPVRVSTLLATVLREGVTNVLRHSKGEHCEISVHERDASVLLAIVNDGVTEAAGRAHNGSGLQNLTARVGMVGGELTAGIEADGRFRLQANVPL
ncbi:MAG TPA: histidine kinase [Actinophytocola sp.]|uniref:sensor histidine kinase n=1 Tax=Actinophytocola sp. TaxID=1872138 RepID=UPI002DBEBFD4|nr:histidine kinase [Actinophytocola sp.]HEU5475368.1 histidine kinase [Actinophytocola sp.]